MNLALAPALFALCAFGPQDDAKQDSSPEDKAETVWEYLVLKYDSNGDARVSEEEYTRGAEHWKRLDKNADGFLDESEFASRGRRGGRRGAAGRRGGGGPRSQAPKAGDKAPDFELVVLPTPKKEGDGKKAAAKSKAEFVKLSSFKGKKPVALIFGSYT